MNLTTDVIKKRIALLFDIYTVCDALGIGFRVVKLIYVI